MDSATFDLYYQNLEEYIQDEDKIITVPYLARTLQISIQDSQNLLLKYLKDQRSLKPDELAACYILTGHIPGKGNGVYFVKEEDLQDKKALFDNIESETLFSLQKCKTVDISSLSLVDDLTKPCEETLLGSVVSKNCIKRTLKVKKLPTPPPSVVKGKSSFFLPKTGSSEKIETSSVKQEPKAKQNGLADMFNKASVTKEKKEKDEKVQKKTNQSTNKSSKGGLASFISKGSNSKDSVDSIKKENENTNTVSQPSEIEELMDVDFHEDFNESTVDTKDVSNEENEEKQSEKKPSKKQGKEKKSKNKRQREKSEEKSTKKRKRIIERHDSESDDIFENDEEDVIENSDFEREKSPSPVQVKPLAPRNKIKKAVEKTYIDEEGFMVTKTEHIYESPDEEEEVKIEKDIPVVKKENTNKPKVEKIKSEEDSQPKAGKGKKGKKVIQNQPSLLSFFKKK